jgi:hypothetical protein
MNRRERRIPIPRTTLVLLIVALALGVAYTLLALIDPDRNRIDLPRVSDTVSRIEIREAGDTVSIERDGGEWYIGDERFPGDTERIEALLDAVRSVESVDVISERGGDDRYGLDSDTVRTLVLFEGETAVLGVSIGNGAAAGDAFYGRVQDESAVVLLPGSLASVVDADQDRYRDTVVASITEEEIATVEIDAPGFDRLVLSRRNLDRPDSDANQSEAERLEREWSAALGGVRLQPNEDGDEPIPGHLRQNLFQELETLRVERFRDSAPTGDPFVQISVARLDGATEELSVYPPDDEWRYPIVATTSPYPGVLPEFRVRRLLLGRSEYIDQFRDVE